MNKWQKILLVAFHAVMLVLFLFIMLINAVLNFFLKQSKE